MAGPPRSTLISGSTFAPNVFSRELHLGHGLGAPARGARSESAFDFAQVGSKRAVARSSAGMPARLSALATQSFATRVEELLKANELARAAAERTVLLYARRTAVAAVGRQEDEAEPSVPSAADARTPAYSAPAPVRDAPAERDATIAAAPLLQESLLTSLSHALARRLSDAAPPAAPGSTSVDGCAGQSRPAACAADALARRGVERGGAYVIEMGETVRLSAQLELGGGESGGACAATPASAVARALLARAAPRRAAGGASDGDLLLGGLRREVVAALLRERLAGPVFGQVGSAELLRMMRAEGACALRRYSRYTQLFRQHAPSDSLHVLLSGRVRLDWHDGRMDELHVELDAHTGRAELGGGARHAMFGFEGATARCADIVDGGWRPSRLATASVVREALVFTLSAHALPRLLCAHCATEFRCLLLSRLPILSDLPARALLPAARHFHLRRARADEVVALQGDDDDALFLVARGTAVVAMLTKEGALVEIGRISAGSAAPYFGNFEPAQRTARARPRHDGARGAALAPRDMPPSAMSARGKFVASVLAADELWLLVLPNASAEDVMETVPDWRARFVRASRAMALANEMRLARDDERQLQARLVAATAEAASAEEDEKARLAERRRELGRRRARRAPFAPHVESRAGADALPPIGTDGAQESARLSSPGMRSEHAEPAASPDALPRLRVRQAQQTGQPRSVHMRAAVEAPVRAMTCGHAPPALPAPR
ncbi:hypothetical protein KFE25_014114 [Diacronema lutheri]|uniref:Cyclic nucleotide-binding domain-containing protein n=1 Tax=Diacronema lutheri TaxID=2081491 RepID=A0A8J5X8K9_DIALT|nr:hypothetical protein KFE25_014114 [Diacronema lutheri]